MIDHRIRPVAVALLLTACTGVEREAASTREGYVLRTIGGEPVTPADSALGCTDRPYAGWFERDGTRWASVDSIGSCIAADRFDPIVRADSGTLEQVGDTLRLTVTGGSIAPAAAGDRALLRGDSLVIRGAPGGRDRVYLRREP